MRPPRYSGSKLAFDRTCEKQSAIDPISSGRGVLRASPSFCSRVQSAPGTGGVRESVSEFLVQIFHGAFFFLFLQNSSGPTVGQDMVSRRRILSRSRDDLHLDNFPEEEDDVWHIKEKLYKVSLLFPLFFVFIFFLSILTPTLRVSEAATAEK